jgi:Zn-dependent protease with chaperone function
VLRLAATFLALWALLVTTTLVWVLDNGGWSACVALVKSPLLIFNMSYRVLWAEGAVGAFLVFAIAFCLNQLVGRGFLQILAPRSIVWPAHLPRPSARTDLLAFRSEEFQAFSFTLLEFGGPIPGVHRREIILLSDAILRRLTPPEREAVIAHELGHIRGLDGRYLTFLRTLARMMRWDPMLAYLISSLTRREEFRADLEAVEITRRPLALARALYKAATRSQGSFALGGSAFLGAGGPRGRREAFERIRRLVELSESPRFAEVESD